MHAHEQEDWSESNEQEARKVVHESEDAHHHDDDATKNSREEGHASKADVKSTGAHGGTPIRPRASVASREGNYLAPILIHRRGSRPTRIIVSAAGRLGVHMKVHLISGDIANFLTSAVELKSLPHVVFVTTGRAKRDTELISI